MTDAQSSPLHAIIVGCGRVGAGMAHRLTAEGYTVTVIDRTTRAFTRLEGCSAERVIGMGYDRGTLLEEPLGVGTSCACRIEDSFAGDRGK